MYVHVCVFVLMCVHMCAYVMQGAGLMNRQIAVGPKSMSSHLSELKGWPREGEGHSGRRGESVWTIQPGHSGPQS